MKCTHCHEKEANTHIKRTINGVTQEMYLCEDCARELGVMDEFAFEPLSMGIDRCSSCGTSFTDIINSGRVGCADCYTKFEDKLEPSIEKLHGRTKHIGKFVTYSEEAEPKKDDSAPKKSEPKSEIEKLKEDLKLAVKEQRFEDAAVIRDKIKDLTQEG